MSIYAYEAQETWLPTVGGMTCSEVHVQETLLQIHFGNIQHGNQDILDADRTISLYGVWRVEHRDAIVAGSGDLDEAATLSALSILKGTTLERFEVSKPGFDLDLHFSGGITVRCFPCDASEFDQDIQDETDFPISWWIDGIGVTDDWEESYDPQGV